MGSDFAKMCVFQRSILDQSALSCPKILVLNISSLKAGHVLSCIIWATLQFLTPKWYISIIFLPSMQVYRWWLRERKGREINCGMDLYNKTHVGFSFKPHLEKKLRSLSIYRFSYKAILYGKFPLIEIILIFLILFSFSWLDWPRVRPKDEHKHFIEKTALKLSVSIHYGDGPNK